MNMQGRLTTAADALTFALAGNATLTLVPTSTGARYTYKIRASEDGELHFVSVMFGPDNDGDFVYMGIIAPDQYRGGAVGYRQTKNSKVTREDKRHLGFAWFWGSVQRGELPHCVEVWHEGACGRCGRKLTVPASIASGFGPECVKLVCEAVAA